MEETKFFGKRELLILGTALATAVLILIFHSRAPAAANNISADAEKAFESCKELSGKEFCYATYFRNLTTATDWHHAFDVLHALQKLDLAANGCHLIAHGISRSETLKDPSKWREIMNTAPQDCSYGAAHGALEVHAASFPDGKLPASEIDTACDNPDTHNCTHILGHLLLVMNDNNIEKSLTQCGTLPHDANGKFECLTGVFMERSTANNLVEHGLVGPEALDWTKRLPETLALCKEQSGTNAVACWKESVHVALVTYNNNFQKLVDMCESAPTEEAARQCIDHGIGVLGGTLNFDFAKTGAICDARVKAPDFKSRCYGNLVNSTLSTIPSAVPEAKLFCNSLEPQYRATCEASIRPVQRSTGD